MPYRVDTKPRALKDLAALPADVLPRVDTVLLSLADNPRPRGAKKLADEDDVWRVRIGDYRVLYTIDADEELVTIVRIRHRREVYRDR